MADLSTWTNGIGGLLGALGFLRGRGEISGALYRQGLEWTLDAISHSTRSIVGEIVSHVGRSIHRQDDILGAVRRKVDEQSNRIVGQIGQVAGLSRDALGILRDLQRRGGGIDPRQLRAETDRSVGLVRGIVGAAAAGATSRIVAELGARIAGIGRQTDRLSHHVTRQVDRVPGIIETAIGAAVPAIIRQIGSALARQSTGITGAVGQVRDRIDHWMRLLTAGVDSVTSILRAAGLDRWAAALQEASGRMRQVGDAVDATTRAILGGVEILTGRIEALNNETARQIAAGHPYLRREARALEALQALFADGLPGATASAQAGGVLGFMSDLISGQAGPFRAFTSYSDSARSRERLDDVTDPRSPTGWRTCVDWYRQELGEDAPWIAGVILYLLSVYTAFASVMSIGATKAEWCRMSWLRDHPHEQASPESVIAMWRYGEIDQAAAIDGLRQWGLEPSLAARMLRASRSPLAPTVVMQAWHRGIIDEAERDVMLQRAGLGPDEQRAVRETSVYIPPIQDLILMAVREVFSPQIRQEYQLDADFPADFADRARRLGMDEDTARDYWASHWGLPSLTQGYRMFHRGVITQEQLQGLMRAQDVMPVWRERLEAISYTPLTRVDIRRMHAMGAIDDARMERAYRDIGYSPADAELMARWTKLLSEQAQAADADADAAGLSRASTVRLFRLGVIDGPRARQLLAEAGVSDDAADAYLTAARLEIELADRAEVLQTVYTRLRSGSLSREAARQRVYGLPLTGAEQELALARIDRLTEETVRVPSRADLDRAARHDLVGESEYVDALVDQGWSVEWARRFWESRPGQ